MQGFDISAPLNIHLLGRAPTFVGLCFIVDENTVSVIPAPAKDHSAIHESGRLSILSRRAKGKPGDLIAGRVWICTNVQGESIVRRED